MHNITVNVGDELYMRLQKFRTHAGIFKFNLAELIRMLLKQWLDQQEQRIQTAQTAQKPIITEPKAPQP